jgi:microcystin-dependent protein
MAEPFLGEIRIFPYTFAPRGWATCSGQLLSIAQNTALFALVGTTYGGDGQTTFGLPDLRGRVPIGQGQGPGLSSYTLGQVAGTETTTLTINQLPSHTHTATGALNAVQTKGSTQQPAAGSMIGRSVDTSGVGATPAIYVPTGTAGTQVALGGLSVSNGLTGGSQPFSLLKPYLVLEPCIALEGVFPSRN